MFRGPEVRISMSVEISVMVSMPGRQLEMRLTNVDIVQRIDHQLRHICCSSAITAILILHNPETFKVIAVKIEKSEAASASVVFVMPVRRGGIVGEVLGTLQKSKKLCEAK